MFALPFATQCLRLHNALFSVRHKYSPFPAASLSTVNAQLLPIQHPCISSNAGALAQKVQRGKKERKTTVTGKRKESRSKE